MFNYPVEFTKQEFEQIKKIVEKADKRTFLNLINKSDIILTRGDLINAN